MLGLATALALGVINAHEDEGPSRQPRLAAAEGGERELIVALKRENERQRAMLDFLVEHGAAELVQGRSTGLEALLVDAAFDGTVADRTGTSLRKVEGLKAQLAEVTHERDQLRRNVTGLRRRLDLLETRLDEMRRGVGAEAAGVRDWVSQQVSALEGALATSGLDVDRLKRRLEVGYSAGQGGPLIPVRAPQRPTARSASLRPLLEADLGRLRAMHTLVRALPLVAPMDHYTITSEFGQRRDPITRRGALHEGLDFGGVKNARVNATGPGVVTEAGRAGAYGLMVEIDHGMGVRTRYAHLKTVLTKVGKRVGAHEAVGIMGRTGRTTGIHVHYEVRLDGEPLDPLRFIEAGERLRRVVQG